MLNTITTISALQYANEGESPQSTCFNPRIKNMNKFKQMCYTLIFIGLILFVFGISLRITFQSDDDDTGSPTEKLSCDEKFDKSMRLAGSLLLGSAAVTEVLAFVLIICSSRQKIKQERRRIGQELNTQLDIYGPPQGGINTCQTLPQESENRAKNSLFSAIIGRMKDNWNRQNRYRDNVLRRSDIEMSDAPPMYNESMNPPPPYDVVVQI